MIFTNWDDHEPDNWLGEEDCVGIHTKNSKMYDIPCSYSKLCQVCNVSEVKLLMIFMSRTLPLALGLSPRLFRFKMGDLGLMWE